MARWQAVPAFCLLITAMATVGGRLHAGEEGANYNVTTHAATDMYSGWRLGMQLYTFNKYTFLEALEKTAALGIDWVEAYPGQAYSKAEPGLRFDHHLPPAKRAEVRQRLREMGLRLVNYGVVKLPKDEAGCREIFEFAREMGIETIMSEPGFDAWDTIDKLCREYRISVAIHNHPKPSRYWSPDVELKVFKGRSEWIGTCADIGHWMRSGIEPIAALRKLKGRVKCFHFGDLNAFGKKEAHDVVWGSGVADVKAILEEMHRQGWTGVVSIEYEHNWYTSVPEIRASIEYFNAVASQLKPSGWTALFAKDLSNAIFKPGAWEMGEDGVLALKGGSYIWTKARYGDFVLDLEFKLTPNANSGVFLRAADLQDYVQTSIEVQIHESTDGSQHGACGAIYDCLSPRKTVVKKAGAWNRYTITCIANKIYVVLNGEQIIDMDLDQWTEPHKNPDGTRNKFRTAYKDMPREGHIGLQDHGHPIWFRNVKIKKM